MQVTELFTGYVGALLAEHAQNPAANWKAKDCAIYLVVALTVRGRTAAQGATTTNQLVNIGDFYTQQVCALLLGRKSTNLNFAIMWHVIAGESQLLCASLISVFGITDCTRAFVNGCG